MIICENLSKKFGAKCLFQGISFTARQGEILSITGASGSGKSTLLNCIGALASPDSGRIEVRENNESWIVTSVSSRRRRLYRRDVVGYLFQDYALVPELTVEKNMLMAVHRPCFSRGKVSRSSLELELSKVGLTGYLERVVNELSGGEQQRVAMARVLVRNPSIVLADEPTGALDPANGDVILGQLRGLADAGATIVIATHDPRVVEASDSTFDLSAFSAPTA